MDRAVCPSLLLEALLCLLEKNGELSREDFDALDTAHRLLHGVLRPLALRQDPQGDTRGQMIESCSCDGPGFCPRYQRKMLMPQYELCKGLRYPEYSEAYRAHWDKLYGDRRTGRQPRPAKPRISIAELSALRKR